jgi:tryptophan halogenase
MKICILGGGSAGWMAAAAISKKFKKQNFIINLVESETIGTVGVGEATLPHIRFFNQSLGIDEATFMRETQATFKLGIEFCDWGKLGDSYIHPFGDFGLPHKNVDFYQYWLKYQKNGELKRPLGDYSVAIQAARNGKFWLPEQSKTKAGGSFGYAYQFDSNLYAKFLRNFAEGNGVVRHEGMVENVLSDNITGNVSALVLDDGRKIEADLFVDCSGFRGMLIEQTLKTGYQDWSHFLPCDRAVAVPCTKSSDLPPYTRATARTAGWQWRIPLQHRTGNGHVYWSEYISDQEAREQLLSNLEGEPLAEPKQLFFKTGRRNAFWNKNVVAIGLSAGFLEPLESTSIHLIQEGITTLMELFPVGECDPLDIEEYNYKMGLNFERVRDFLLLHYIATERDDTPMWRYFKNMTLPDSLQSRLEAWKNRAYIPSYEFGVFLPASWIAVMQGQNLHAQHYDPRADGISSEEFKRYRESLENEIATDLDRGLSHAEYIKHYGAQTAQN